MAPVCCLMATNTQKCESVSLATFFVYFYYLPNDAQSMSPAKGRNAQLLAPNDSESLELPSARTWAQFYSPQRTNGFVCIV